MPDLPKLCTIARLTASLIRDDHRVLSHCKMGHNRSALLAGVILTCLGPSGEEALNLLRMRRSTALYNAEYAAYLRSLPGQMEH